MLLSIPDIIIKTCTILNPDFLLLIGPKVSHCFESLRPMQSGKPSVACPSKILRGCYSLVTVVLSKKGIKRKLCSCQFTTGRRGQLPLETCAQKSELIALTWALILGKGKKPYSYADSKYVFLMLRAAIWKAEAC